MDALKATRTIRARVGRGTPIIAMIANAFDGDRAGCLAAGMNDHVPKMVVPERVYATLLRFAAATYASKAATQALTKASRSALMTSACVVGMPCGKPL
jgi:CheY-like chemotaxis protein